MGMAAEGFSANRVSSPLGHSQRRHGGKIWLAAGFLGCASLVGGRFWLFPGMQAAAVPAQEGSENASQPAALRVEVVHPTKGGLQRTTTQPGTVQSYESVQLYAAVSGYLKLQTVDIGDRVKKGQLLIKVDVPELEKQKQRSAAQVEQSRARVQQMKAKVASADADLLVARATVVQAEAAAKSAAATLRFREQQLQRMKELFALKSIDERLVDEKTEQRDAALETERSARAAILTANAQVTAAQAKIDQAHADVAAAAAEVQVAQAELEKVQVLVEYSSIVAPFDGIITQRSLFVGDFVRAGTESGGRPPLLTVQRTDLFRVVVQVPDRDVPYCDPGDSAIVEMDALPGVVFPAKVSRVASSEDPDTRLMRVEIDVASPKRQIRNGMYGRVTIILDKGVDQLTLPSSCLVGRSRDGKSSVYVVKNGRARLTPINVGQDNGLRVAVVSGLSQNDAVILSPGSEIAEGIPVQCAEAPGKPGH
jgi:RND family efflux transporter MFP subunit